MCLVHGICTGDVHHSQQIRSACACHATSHNSQATPNQLHKLDMYQEVTCTQTPVRGMSQSASIEAQPDLCQGQHISLTCWPGFCLPSFCQTRFCLLRFCLPRFCLPRSCLSRSCLHRSCLPRVCLSRFCLACWHRFMQQEGVSVQEGCQDVGQLVSLLRALHHACQNRLQQLTVKVQPAAVTGLQTNTINALALPI